MLLPFSCLVSGMKLKEDVVCPQAGLLLSKGSIITEPVINRLKSFNIKRFCIEEDINMSNIKHEPLSAAGELKKISSKMFDSVYFYKKTDVEFLNNIVEEIIFKLISSKNLFISFLTAKNCDEHTFMHCVRTCLISCAIGFKMGLQVKEVRDLGMGALLHDIGKSKISPYLLNKKDPLSPEEWEEIKRHVIYGYNMVQDKFYNGEISESSLLTILQHHEKVNGDGYPDRIKEKNIHFYAQIVAVADVYDALVSKRDYRACSRFTSCEVFEYFMGSSGTLFSSDIVRNFLGMIEMYPAGSFMKLSTGEAGISMGVSKDKNYRPVVKILQGKDMRFLMRPYQLDLANYPNIGVVALHEPEEVNMSAN